MDLKRFVGASTMALAMAVLAVAPLSAQTTDTGEPEAIVEAFFEDRRPAATATAYSIPCRAHCVFPRRSSGITTRYCPTPRS